MNNCPKTCKSDRSACQACGRGSFCEDHLYRAKVETTGAMVQACLECVRPGRRKAFEEKYARLMELPLLMRPSVAGMLPEIRECLA